MKKILMIFYAFPPRSSIGAIRNAKFVEYLPKYNWQPIILTREWKNELLPLQEPSKTIIYRTSYKDNLNSFYGVSNIGKNDFIKNLKNKISPKMKKWIKLIIKEILAYPDENISWKKEAVRMGRMIIKKEKPDIIFSSSSPVTSHIVAYVLNEEFHIPWIADFRDLWTQNHYIHHTFFRRILEKKLEKNILEKADLLITVSDPLAQKLEKLHNKKVKVITNGFEPKDYPSRPSSTNFFSLTYTGSLYEGKRDPSLLFMALKELLREKIISSKNFQVRFYGPKEQKLIELINLYQLQDIVSWKGTVNYKESLIKQMESTVLLLFNWLSTEEKGVYTGKVFEYLGAKRPILAIPKNNGVIDELLENTKAGVVANNKNEIKEIIRNWYVLYKKNGNLPYQGKDSVIVNYTRQKCTEKLAQILNNLNNS